MRQLKCEMCGSTDLVKQHGVFVCQNCGAKYSVEDAKKLMVEVKVSGTLKVDNSELVENLITNGLRAFDDSRYADAEHYFGRVLEKEPNNAAAILYQGLSIGWQGNAVRYNMDKACSAAIRAMNMSCSDDIVGNSYRKISDLEDALIMLISNSIQERFDSLKNRIKELSSIATSDMFNPYSNSVDYAKSACEKERKDFNNFLKTYSDIISKTEFDCIAVYEKAVEKASVSQFRRLIDFLLTKKKTYISVGNFIDAFYSHIISVSANNVVERIEHLIARAYSIKDSKEKKINEDATKKYWNEHLEEKKLLEKEYNKLIQEIKPIEDEYNQARIRNKSIEDRIISLEREKSIPVKAAEVEAKIVDEIKDLDQQLDDLSPFNIKERRSINSKRKDLSVRLEEASIVTEREKEKRNQKIEGELCVLKNEMNQIDQDKLNDLSNKKREIEKKINEIKKKLYG